jgi:hypothetical protein
MIFLLSRGPISPFKNIQHMARGLFDNLIFVDKFYTLQTAKQPVRESEILGWRKTLFGLVFITPLPWRFFAILACLWERAN